MHSRSARLLVLFAAVSLGSCQCLVAVDENLDGGSHGMDAGPQCQTAADCVMPDAGGQFCQGAAMSCIASSCVLECRGNRTCTPVIDGACHSCGQTITQCCETSLNKCRARVETNTCPGTRFSPGSSWVIEARDGGCTEFDMLPGDGGVSAGVWFGSNGDGVATIPELGGTCTLQGLATGLRRIAVQCPVCSFIEEGC